MAGIGGLLNLGQPIHSTVIVTDFDHSDRAVSVLRRALEGVPTRVVHLSLLGRTSTQDRIDVAECGLNKDDSYISVLALLCQHESFKKVRQLHESIPRGDCARIELPSVEMGFELSNALAMTDVILSADYELQDIASDLFFRMLASSTPYCVEINTPGGTLRIGGSNPWFQLAGRLVNRESRILPGGEVAYTGSDINGVFTVTGGLLATPQAHEAAPLARALTQMSRSLQHDPVSFEICNGLVSAVNSKGPLAKALEGFLQDERYRQVTEVGVSFNTACKSLIHDWPASSNEGAPGVHIGLGGDPDPNQEWAKETLVHLDLISSTASVSINNQLFMKRM